MKITGILRCMHTTMATTDATRPKTSKLRCQLFERQATAAEVQPGSKTRQEKVSNVKICTKYHHKLVYAKKVLKSAGDAARCHYSWMRMAWGRDRILVEANKGRKKFCEPQILVENHK